MIAAFMTGRGSVLRRRPGCRRPAPLGALGRRKPLQDSPTPAGNPTAASALLRLEQLSGRKEYREIAERTLASFAGVVEHFGLYAGSYGLALERLLLDPVQVVVVGSGPEAERLEALALARFAVNKTVIRIAPSGWFQGHSPGIWRKRCFMHRGRKAWRPGPSFARGACLPPVTTAEALAEAWIIPFEKNLPGCAAG
jgi:uncharacterized protein YyaL (SSP411 family)